MNFLYRRRSLAILLVLLAGVIIYSRTFQVPFVLDDERSIIQNEVIRNLDNFYANSSGYQFLPNRYVAFLTFALNYHFGDLDVAGYHAVNLVIHLLAALLVFALLRLTFRTPYFQVQGPGSKVQGQATQNPTLKTQYLIPLFAAMLFVVHPVQIQAVTYIVQRITSLATMFYLLSLVLYVRARLSIEKSRGRFRESKEKTLFAGLGGRLKPGLMIAGSVLAAVLAMKTKEIAFTLPIAAMLYELCFFRGSWKRRLLYLLPLLATLPIIPLTVLTSGHSTDHVLVDIAEQTRVQTSMGRMDYLFTQFRVIVTYLRLLILPINQNLDYDYPVYTTFFTPPVFLSFLLLMSIVVLAAYLFWKSRYLRINQVENGPGSPEKQFSQPQPGVPSTSLPCLRLIAFGIFWFFLTLAVESSLIPIKDVIVEHRLYLPSFGAVTVIAAVFWLLAVKFSQPTGRKLLFLSAVVVVLGLGIATWQRNYVWGNKIRLWRDVVAKSPDKGRANNNLGVALEEAGRRQEAFKVLSRAIVVDPGYFKSYYNLADLYLVSDQPDAALPLLKTAIRLNPDFTEAYVDMGAALMRGGQFREAAMFLEKNIDHIGDDAEAHFYLGSAYVFLGKKEAARRELDIVSRHDAKLASSLAGLLGLRPSQRVPHGAR